MAQVAKKSGFTRTFIYYLLAKRLLRPTGRPWARAEFDRTGLRMAVILRELQRRGVGPTSVVHAVEVAHSTYKRRVAAERVEPLEKEISVLTDRVLELVGKAAASGSLRSVERDLLRTARRCETLKRRKDQEIVRIGSPAPDDPEWRALDEMFGSSARRKEFVALLMKTRKVGGRSKDIAEGQEVAAKEEDADGMAG